MKINQNYIQTSNGNIAVRSAGSSDTLILLVHGAASDSRIFYRQMRALSGKYLVAAIDLPGHGKSDQGEMSFDSYITAIKECAAYFSAQRVVLTGHSFGSALVLAAGPQIKNVEAYILFSPAKNYQKTRHILDRDLLHGQEIEDIFSSRMYSSNNRLMHSLIKRGSQLVSADLLLNDLDICFSLKPFDPSSITQPVLSCACSKDKIVPVSDSREFTEEFPSGIFKEFKMDGHVPFVDSWEQCNQEIIFFLDSIFHSERKSS